MIVSDEEVCPEQRSRVNELLNCFQSSDEGDPENFIAAFDWEKYGVRIPYVIFITGRCGSTLLTNYLQNTELCGNPAEFFNESAVPFYNQPIGATNLAGYFTGLVKRNTTGGRFGFQIDPYRLNNFKQLVRFRNVFDERTVFFWMTRRDIVGQAYSFAKAKKSGIWHEYEANGGVSDTPPGNDAIALSDAQLWLELIQILKGEQAAYQFFAENGITPKELDYEGLVSDKYKVVIDVMQALFLRNADILLAIRSIEDKTRRLTYSDRYGRIAEFQTLYRHELKRVTETRRTVDVEALKRWAQEKVPN